MALTGIHPLHAVGEGGIGDEGISTPSRVGDDNVGGGDGREDKGEECG